LLAKQRYGTPKIVDISWRSKNTPQRFSSWQTV
jgi:hypothetical protein